MRGDGSEDEEETDAGMVEPRQVMLSKFLVILRNSSQAIRETRSARNYSSLTRACLVPFYLVLLCTAAGGSSSDGTHAQMHAADAQCS